MPEKHYFPYGASFGNDSGDTVDVRGDTLVGATATATLTNKTLTSPVVTQAPNASTGATQTLVATNSGQTYLFDRAGGVTYTLPAAVAGTYFDFIVTVLQTSGAYAIVAAGAGVYVTGSVIAFSGEDVTPSATLGPKQFAGNGSSHVKLTTNATTTGGGIGSWFRAICLSTTKWYIYGVVNSPSGSLATPYST